MKPAWFAKRSGMAVCALLISALVYLAAPADASHGKKKRERKRSEGHASQLPEAYKAHCGGCHMAYGAYLLPEASWRGILDAPDDHFGAALALDEQEREQVAAYLLPNAADRAGGKLGRKIMRCLSGQTPERISTLPYIQRKHRKLDPAVFARPSVGGIGNCSACHSGAEQGDFDDDRVSIPR